MRLLKSLLLLFITTGLTLANPKVSECAEGWGVYTSKQSDTGSCGLPIPEGIGRVSLSSLGIKDGASCGECYEVFGPSGSTVVMAFDSCNAGYACQQNDTINFILSKDDYTKIGGTIDGGNIYSMGYQKVSCDFKGNIQANFIKPSSGSSNYQYYFGVTFSNYNLAIESIGIKGNGMSSYQTLERHSNQFNFNKKDKDLFFPATLALKSVTGQVVTYIFESSPQAGVDIDLKTQFKVFLNDNLEGQCGMGILPKYLYKDSLSFGWVAYESWNSTYDFGAKDSDVSGNVTKADLVSTGGIKFTRPGGFETKTLDQLMFSVKSSVNNPKLGIYFSNDVDYSFTEANSTWGTYAINISTLGAKEVENSLIFINREDKQVTYWFDNIQWIFKDGVQELPSQVTVAPDPNAPTKGPSTGSATGSVTGGISSGVSGGITSGDDGFSSSNVDNEISLSEHTNSSSASYLFVSLSFLLLSILFNILF